MKRILIALFVMGLLVSCGKVKEVESTKDVDSTAVKVDSVAKDQTAVDTTSTDHKDNC